MTIEEQIAELEGWLPALLEAQETTRAEYEPVKQSARQFRQQLAAIRIRISTVTSAIETLREFDPKVVE